MVEEGKVRSILSCPGEKLLVDIKKIFYLKGFFFKEVFYALVFSVQRVFDHVIWEFI